MGQLLGDANAHTGLGRHYPQRHGSSVHRLDKGRPRLSQPIDPGIDVSVSGYRQLDLPDRSHRELAEYPRLEVGVELIDGDGVDLMSQLI